MLIKPVSDLRNYNAILKDCSNGEPVFLTKNGHGRYVLLDLDEYEKQQETIKLLSKLSEAEEVIQNGADWLTLDEVKVNLGV